MSTEDQSSATASWDNRKTNPARDASTAILASASMAVSSLPLARADSWSLRRFLELDLLDNRYPALHGLRVFGVVSVVQWHVSQILVFDRKLPVNTSWSDTSFAIFFGMDLFFVLSGFLIGSILLHSIDSSGWRGIRRFYLRRAFRTFPPYYLVLAYLVLVTPMSALRHHNLIYECTYLTNYVANRREDVFMGWGWSLGLEEQFYLTVPFLFLLLRKLRGDKARLALLLALWSSALILRIVKYRHHGEEMPLVAFESMYFRTHTRSDTLIAGLILAYVHSRWRAPISRWLESPLNRAALAMPSMLCLWLLLHPTLFGAGTVRLFHVFAWGTLTSIMYFGAVLLLLNGGPSWFQRVFSAPIFRRIATLGYGVYLVHMPVCDKLVSPVSAALVRDWHWPAELVWTLTLPAVILASLVLAYVLHVLVEKPSLRLRDRLAG
jgi:peptidoglycan/LPS O-acetylase OafA/YrhL